MGRASGQKRAASAPTPAPAPRPTALRPAQALALPLTFTLLLIALGALPSIRQNPNLLRSFWGAAAALLAWNAVLLIAAARSGRTLILEIVLRKQHYMQACAHLSILLYWGWYWHEVYDSAPLILAQLVFAYALDALLSWSRRDTYTFGFGPFPIIFSTNLFLWFKPDWFYLQFMMLTVGFLAKELIRWNKEGRRTHIFNPSSFTLMLFSLMLLVTGKTGISWGPEIAATQANPPYIYLWIFLVSLPGQFLFGVASMTLSAVATTYGFCLLYLGATGMHYFAEQPIPIAVFLGMHLLFTDPSTAPRTELGRITFGVLYGLSVVGLASLLTHLNLPAFYDKLLPVPILNLTIQGIDKAARSDLLKRFDPGTLGRTLMPRWRNLAYMSVWAMTFATMQAMTGTRTTLMRADALLDQGMINESIEEYREFVRTDPADSEGHDKLGVALMQAGRVDDAVASFQRSIALQPDSPRTNDNLGVALMRKGRLAEAASSFQRSIALQPDNPKTLNNLGVVLMRTGHVEDAVSSLQRAVALQPDNPEAHDNLGQAFVQAGRVDDAVRSLQRAVELQPNSADAQDNLGAVLIRAGRFTDAVTSLQRAIELQPNSAEAHDNLGQALIQAGRTDDAVASFQRAVELQPGSAQGHYNLAHALTTAGQPKAAAAQLREALRAQPDWPPALISLAWLEATEPDAPRNPEDAIRLASRAADLSGRRDAHVLDVLGVADAAAGRFAEASRTAEAAEALASGSDPNLAAQIKAHLSVYQHQPEPQP